MRTISERLRKVPYAEIFSIFLFAAALIMPRSAFGGVLDGVRLCIETVVPSLFCFIFLASMLVESGAAARLGTHLSVICRILFGLPGCCGGALIAAMLGGYPAGAKAAAALFERGDISRGQAQRLMLFCFCAGPAFVIGTVGSVTSGAAAWLLLGVQYVSVILCGIISRLLFKKTDCAEGSGRHDIQGVERNISVCVVSSAKQTASALLSVCVFVTLFSAAVRMLSDSGVMRQLSDILCSIGVRSTVADALLPSLLEVTLGCTYAAKAGLPAIAFALGFGGMSVHMQIAGICSSIGIDMRKFTLLRILQGTLCALLTAAVSRFLPSVPASLDLSNRMEMTASTPAGAVTLVIMCVMCILCLPEDVTPSGRRLIKG